MRFIRVDNGQTTLLRSPVSFYVHETSPDPNQRQMRQQLLASHAALYTSTLCSGSSAASRSPTTSSAKCTETTCPPRAATDCRNDVMPSTPSTSAQHGHEMSCHKRCLYQTLMASKSNSELDQPRDGSRSHAGVCGCHQTIVGLTWCMFPSTSSARVCKLLTGRQEAHSNRERPLCRIESLKVQCSCISLCAARCCDLKNSHLAENNALLATILRVRRTINEHSGEAP